MRIASTGLLTIPDFQRRIVDSGGLQPPFCCKRHLKNFLTTWLVRLQHHCQIFPMTLEGSNRGILIGVRFWARGVASTCASRDTRVIFLPDGRVSSNATVNNPVENKTNTLEDFWLDYFLYRAGAMFVVYSRTSLWGRWKKHLGSFGVVWSWWLISRNSRLHI